MINSKFLSNIEHLDSSYSIKSIVSNKKEEISVNTRYVGGAISMHAKISIASFIHDVMELFIEKTMTKDVKDLMEKFGLNKILCSLSVTYTNIVVFK